MAQDELVLNEFQLRGFAAIIDVAIIGRTLRGFEIKSDRDSVARRDRRFERQISHYDRACDACVLVTTERHWLWPLVAKRPVAPRRLRLDKSAVFIAA